MEVDVVSYGRYVDIHSEARTYSTVSILTSVNTIHPYTPVSLNSPLFADEAY
jgi:hypothetical protein